jgi:hypothetical protein
VDHHLAGYRVGVARLQDRLDGGAFQACGLSPSCASIID